MHHRHAVSEKRMCLGTFSRLARSLATVYIFARVRIFGTSVPFYVTGNSLLHKKLRKTWASSLRSSGALHTDRKPGRYFPYEL